VADKLRIGLIGAGSMGALHARTVASHPDSELTWVVDADAERAESVAARYGSISRTGPTLEDVDAVIVATPTQHHFGIARSVIEARIPLLLEKPLTEELADSKHLVSLARERGSVLSCGLLERFNPAVRTAADIAREPFHVATVRHSPYAERIRTGVAGDLLIHDVDLVIRLFGESPVRVQAQCGFFEPRSDRSTEDVADASLTFSEGQIATLSASRVSQRKIRTLAIVEPGRLIEVDLLRQDITVYRHVQPLQLQLDHFLQLARGEADPVHELDGLLASHEVVASVREQGLSGTASGSGVHEEL
jgi:predicted dehydrogenase